MNSKDYAITFNPYPEYGDGDGFNSMMIVKGMTANDAIAMFMAQTNGKGYVPLTVAVVVEPYGMSAIKVVNMHQHTTVRYEVA